MKKPLIKGKPSFKKIRASVRKWLDHWVGWLVICAVFLIVIQVLFSFPAPCHILDATWEAGDLISFAGTIVLGFVAWQQNARLLKVEEDTYVNGNGCIAHIESVEFMDSVDEGYEKQVLIARSILDSTIGSEPKSGDIVLKIELSVQEHYVTLAHVKSIDITLNAKNSTLDRKLWIIKASALIESYVRVGIGKETVSFLVVIRAQQDEAESFFNELKRNQARVQDSLNIDIDLQLVTQKNVMTKMKCQAYDFRACPHQLTVEFRKMYREPMTFWIEHQKVSVPKIKKYRKNRNDMNPFEIISVKGDKNG